MEHLARVSCLYKAKIATAAVLKKAKNRQRFLSLIDMNIRKNQRLNAEYHAPFEMRQLVRFKNLKKPTWQQPPT